MPYLHNGYYTTLIKSGEIGIFLVILYWFILFKRFKKKSIERYEKDLVKGIVAGMALSMFFIHGVFWGGNEEVFYLFLVWTNVKNTDLNKNLLELEGGK